MGEIREVPNFNTDMSAENASALTITKELTLLKGRYAALLTTKRMSENDRITLTRLIDSCQEIVDLKPNLVKSYNADREAKKPTQGTIDDCIGK